MEKHIVTTRKEWMEKRLELLREEKELTIMKDKLIQKRMQLPWVEIEKEYQFQTEKGQVSLSDLFLGNSQLMIYHFMFGPDYEAGCPSCSAIADGFEGSVTHLANHDVTIHAVSRAPLEKLLKYKKRMGWTFPWASSAGSDFNHDFNVWFTEEEQLDGAVRYNFRKEQKMIWREEGGGSAAEELIAAMCGTDVPTYHRDRPGLSTFIKKDGKIYHVYSSYARGLDEIWSMYQWLDRAPMGRNENKGVWWRRHDEY